MEMDTICLWYDHDEEEAVRLCPVPTPDQLVHVENVREGLFS